MFRPLGNGTKLEHLLMDFDGMAVNCRALQRCGQPNEVKAAELILSELISA